MLQPAEGSLLDSRPLSQRLREHSGCPASHKGRALLPLGWHFSYAFSSEQIFSKLVSFMHADDKKILQVTRHGAKQGHTQCPHSLLICNQRSAH